MNLRAVVLSFLLGAALAGGTAWFLLRREAPADGPEAGRADRGGGPSGTLGAGPSSDGAAPVPALEGSPRALAHAEALEAENLRLQEEVTALRAKVAELAPPPLDPQAFRFGLPDTTPVFNKAPWGKLAGHMKRLGEKLVELEAGITKGEEPSPKVISEIVQDNQPLAEFAVAFGTEVSDPNPNGAYTHPAVVANLMRAALAAAGDPLARDQEIAIKALGDAWMGETQRTLAGIPSTAPALARTVAEVDAKLRFLASAKNVLTPSQRGTLFHPETEGRLKLDLLSPALVYVLSFPVEATSTEDLAKSVVGRLFAQAGLAREDLSGYEWVGRQWVGEIGTAVGPYTGRSKDLIFPHVDQVQARARAQVAATERVLGMGGLAPEEMDKLRAVRALLYPYVMQR